MYTVKLNLDNSVRYTTEEVTSGINIIKGFAGFGGILPVAAGNVCVLFDTQAHADAFAAAEQTRLGEGCISAEVISLDSQTDFSAKDFFTLQGNDYPYWLKQKLEGQ